MSTQIAILLTVHNRKGKTLKCLQTLFAQKVPDKFTIKVFLTDDGCTDGTYEAVKSRFPQVYIIKGDGSLYWNRGMIKAWEEALKVNHFDFYLWINDDTFLLANALTDILTTSHNFHNKDIIVGTTLDTTRKQVTYGCHTKNGIIDVRGDYDPDVAITHFNGNFVLIPKYVYEKVGINDYHYHHALGDFDYGLTARKKGINIRVCPNIIGICDRHASIPKWKDPSIPLYKRVKAFYDVGANSANPFEYFYFRKKNFGLPAAIATFISNHLHLLFPKLWK